MFRKIDVDNIEQLSTELGVLDNRFSYVLHLDCDYDIKEQVSDRIKEMSNVVTYKVTTKSIKQEGSNVKPEDIKIESNLDVMKSFKDFLGTGVDLRYPMNLYNDVLKESKEADVNNAPKYNTEQVINTWVENCGIVNKDVKSDDKFENTTSNLENTTSKTMNTLF